MRAVEQRPGSLILTATHWLLDQGRPLVRAAHRQNRENHGGLRGPLLQGCPSCPQTPRWGGATYRRGQKRGSLGPSAGCSITGFLLHTAGCRALCCSRRGACFSAFLLLLLATLAALIALVTILGLPPRVPGQVVRLAGRRCGAQRDGGHLILTGFSRKWLLDNSLGCIYRHGLTP